MRHYLLDASVLVDFLNKSIETKAVRVRAAVTKLLALKTARKARLYVPNVCMAECSKAFARTAYEALPPHKAGDAYRTYVDALLELVSSRRTGTISSLDLVREDLEDIEDIFKFEHPLPRRDRAGSLSGVDAIIIAMGRRLIRRHGDDDVLIVTAEKDIVAVCQRFRPDLPAAAYAQAHVPDA